MIFLKNNHNIWEHSFKTQNAKRKHSKFSNSWQGKVKSGKQSEAVLQFRQGLVFLTVKYAFSLFSWYFFFKF